MVLEGNPNCLRRRADPRSGTCRKTEFFDNLRPGISPATDNINLSSFYGLSRSLALYARALLIF